MPTYEYVCPQCGIFEQFHSITITIDHCPKCGKEVRRLISRNQNIIFKGSGFHVTDNRSGDYNKKAASDNPASPVSTTTSNENKPAQTDSKAS
jgi:putative FmdB family regulatory protein